MDSHALGRNDFESMTFNRLDEAGVDVDSQHKGQEYPEVSQHQALQHNGDNNEKPLEVAYPSTMAEDCNNGNETAMQSELSLKMDHKIAEVRYQLQPNFNIERDKRIPLIVQEDSGLIKKIKISTAQKLVQSFAQSVESSTPKSVKALLSEDKSPLQQRSSTPLSREFMALQKTQNESKIIKKFVTDAMIEKTRKAKVKDQNNSFGQQTSTTSPEDHSYTTFPRQRNNNHNNASIYTEDADGEMEGVGQTKRLRKKRFVPLKNEESQQRPRTKSMHDSDYSDNSNSSFSQHVYKKWPSEELLANAASKRTNMRSENSQFVQKHKEFLQHVINSTKDTPLRRSQSHSADSMGNLSHSGNLNHSKYKSRSCKRLAAEFDTDDEKDMLEYSVRTRSLSHTSGNNSGVESNTDHTKRSRSKERFRKRKKSDASEDDDKSAKLSQTLGMECSTTTEERDDLSLLNSSNNSVMIANNSMDVTTTSVENSDHMANNLRNMWLPPPKPGSDSFCWKCHEANVNIACSKCIRSFHGACAKVKDDGIWICPDCTTVDNILNSTKKSRRNELAGDLLSQLLTYALARMRHSKGTYPPEMPYAKVSRCRDLIVNPVSFATLEEKINSKEYRCTEEFVNDAKWMVHNAHILPNKNKLTLATKNILKICRQEINEIDTCPECYLNANSRTDWFLEVCSHPHLLLWAKLKGFPYWPAKAMSFSQNSSVNVRFFGQHDRAFVSAKDCFLYSQQDPNTQTGKRAARELADCMKEVELHIEKIKNKVGGFRYAPFKTPYDPGDEMRQLEEMMPGVRDFIEKQQAVITKPSLQFKIYKTADNNLSIVQKASSTPDLSASHQQPLQTLLQDADSDLHNASSAKKKKLSSACEEEKKVEENATVTLSSAKYEVIKKVTSDDSNSSKLSTVILKRKSANGGEVKRNPEDEQVEIPLPKIQKTDETHGGEDFERNATIKCTPERVLLEKSKSKHGKPEARFPVLTIKPPKDMKTTSNESPKPLKIVITGVMEKEGGPSTSTTKPLSQKQNESSSQAQQAVENLVKNKQGVTIKKILRDATVVTTCNNGPNTSTTAIQIGKNTTNNSEVSANKVQPSKPIEKAQEAAPKKTADEDQQITSALKGLVPFVEIKKEVLSDNEEEFSKEPPKTTIEDSNTCTAEAIVEQPEATAALVGNSRPSSVALTLSSNNSPPKITDSNPLPTTLITQVKDEIFSDEGEPATAAEEQIGDTLKQMPSPRPPSGSGFKNTAAEIRVVGGTTIQKISNKNTPPPQGNNVHTSKRTMLKGIPYGPLPASAYAKLCAEPSQNESNVGIATRAKRSFQQNVLNTDKLRGNTDNPSVNGGPALVAVSVAGTTSAAVSQANSILSNHHLESNARPMSRNTMVAIPVDVAATSRSTDSLGGTMMSSVPVPPLTAVSKTVPSANNAYQSVARNAAVTLTVSGTSGSLSSPTVLGTKAPVVISPLASTATASTSATMSIARNSPVNIVSTTIPPASTATTSLVTTSSTSMPPIPPLSLSTPPPLAGLSGISLSNSVLNGAGIAAETIPTPSGSINPNTLPLSAEAQTQTQTQLAESISRVLPKLAPRPKSLLQTELRPAFPAQAGPVCNRLYQNAFKITDFFMTAIEETMADLAQGDEVSLQAKLALVTMELERAKSAQEDLRKSMEAEKQRMVNETRKQCQGEWKQREAEWKQKEIDWKLREVEWKRLVEDTKRKQWCAQCGNEANFYCCWNTSYCDYPCQQLHWARHATNCAQTRPSSTPDTSNTNRSATTTTTTPIQKTTSQSQERLHIVKSNQSSLPANIHTKSSPSPSSSVAMLKKEKTAKNASTVQPSSASSSTSRSAEVLKLPATTYIRQIHTASLGSGQLRCNTTYSIPVVQRFPIPTTTCNTSTPSQTFTILHQGNNWVMSSGPQNMVTNSTVAAPIASVPQIYQHRSGGGSMAAPSRSSPKASIRYI
uniref:Protein kinase C-binding protein 1 n=1 Tax=Stomoxys calcitrans TaxID=35570 RepID=A0A1I8PLC9_STOCA